MAKIELDGKTLTQWDTDRWIILSLEESESVNEVHYANSFSRETLVVDVVSTGDQITAPIPDVLLQSSGKLKVWMVIYTNDGERAVDIATIFDVMSRPKPTDFFYTETEMKSYKMLEDKIRKLENNEYMKLLDKNSGKTYELLVIDGKLTMSEVV